jgi:hypothetical protein
MNNKDYSGWTNKQTWNINITYEEVFREMCKSQTFDDVEHVADAFKQIVDELEVSHLTPSTLASYAVEEYLDCVNWNEIAEHFADDFEMFQEESDEDQQEIKGLRELIAEMEHLDNCLDNCTIISE